MKDKREGFRFPAPRLKGQPLRQRELNRVLMSDRLEAQAPRWLEDLEETDCGLMRETYAALHAECAPEAPTVVHRLASAIALQMCARWRDGRREAK